MKTGSYFTCRQRRRRISVLDIYQALQSRDYRNDRHKDQLHRLYEEGVTSLHTEGTVVGQVNALTVQTVGSDSFGAPTRITARTYMGRKGVVNIEHMVKLSGPIQHKGVLGLEGYLRGTFSQHFPLSFSCYLTFEQSYVGIEGDSASLAELCAILSSLSEIPLRQDIAITGSINQFGEVQSVGGINDKIEGFFYICQQRGWTGEQGVIIPETNRDSVAVIPEVSDAISKGKFHIWTVDSIGDALEILTGVPAGQASFTKDGVMQKTVFGKAYQKLKIFDQELAKRGHIAA